MAASIDENGDPQDGDLWQPIHSNDGQERLFVGVITDDVATEHEVSPLGVYLCAVDEGPLGRSIKPIAKFTSEDEALDFIVMMRVGFGAITITEWGEPGSDNDRGVS